MSFEAKIIEDSVCDISKKRITSFQVKYPRFIHSELMTHRVFSRNASSSRAIPVKRSIEMIKEDTAMPIHWGRNKPGMQADEQCDEKIAIYDYPSDDVHFLSKELAWYEARDRAIEVAEAFDKAGYHKQIVNRILEPFSHIHVIITSTEWDNFWKLRCHKDAQPEFQHLATMMLKEYATSTPRPLIKGQWHAPYVNQSEFENVEQAIKCSVARCARVSYINHDGTEANIEKDLELYEQLVVMQPAHSSPAEHQATPSGQQSRRMRSDLTGNFKGWNQYRQYLDKNEILDIWFEYKGE